MKKTGNYLLIFCIIFSILGLSGIAGAQTVDKLTGMELETTSLTMEIGETYTFDPIFTTETISGYVPIGLHLFSSDENVVQTDKTLNTIKAVGGGNATVQIYSSGYEFSAECSIHVNGAAKNLVSKGSAWKNPPQTQLDKILDPNLKAYFEMLGKPEMAATASELAKAEEFTTIVTVTPGRAGSLAEAIRMVGMDPVYAFESLDMIAVTGTAEQYLILLKSDNILSLEENRSFEPSAAEATLGMMEGQAETISHFSNAYSAGLNGSGTAVVIFDSGIVPGHDQFTGKTDSGIILQACFSTVGSSGSITYNSVCKNGEKEDLASAENNETVLSRGNYFHGTHVAAIAAGKNGVAPKADIIAINVFTEFEQACKNAAGELTTCYSHRTFSSDIMRGITFLTGGSDQIKNGNITIAGKTDHIAAANFSISNGNKYKSTCPKDVLEAGFKQLLQQNIIPTVASGNDHFDGAVSWPACAPSAFVVGSLWDSGDPQVADYSNHGNKVNLLAPGTQVLSASSNTSMYARLDGTSMATPMATGSFALLSAEYPEMTTTQLEALLTGISTQTATRKSVKKPVLDFTNISSVKTFLSDGPTIRAYGGNKQLQLSFSTLPFNTTYKLSIYKADPSDITQPGVLIKTVSGKNLKTTTIKSLINDQVYVILADCSVTLGKTSYTIPPVTVYGMPMTQGSGFAMNSISDNEIQFSWTPQANTTLTVEYDTSLTNKSETITDANGKTAHVSSGQMLYASFYKTVENSGITFFSLPTNLQTMSVTAPLLTSNGAGNQKLWFSFAADSSLTGRQVQVWSTNASGEALKKLSSTMITNKKTPEDIVITGLKNGTQYIVKVRNYIKVSNKTYYSDWFKSVPQAPFAPTSSGSASLPDFTNLISGVSATVSSGAVQIRYDKNLALDGYSFEVKPILPNHKKVTQSVAISKAAGSYKITGLTNGWLYKLRFREYRNNGKNTLYSSYFPGDPDNLSSYALKDNSWQGLTFVPLPAPAVEFSRGTNGDAEIMIITVTNENSADGFAVAYTAYGYESKSSAGNTLISWAEGNKTNYVFTLESGMNYTFFISLYKDISYASLSGTQTYYGPAATQSFILDSDDYILYGPKSPDEFDLLQLADYASAAQVNGMVLSGDTVALISKTALSDSNEIDEPAFAEINELANSDEDPFSNEEEYFIPDPEIIIGSFEITDFEESWADADWGEEEDKEFNEFFDEPDAVIPDAVVKVPAEDKTHMPVEELLTDDDIEIEEYDEIFDDIETDNPLGE